MTAHKREGDGASPIGSFALRGGFYRSDRMMRPVTGLKLERLSQADGWCDAPAHTRYNCFVSHPFEASAERLWREDRLYDVIVVIGHNDRPRVRGVGSAIFLHIARDGFKPTEGCIAVGINDMRRLLTLLGPRSKIRIGA